MTVREHLNRKIAPARMITLVCLILWFVFNPLARTSPYMILLLLVPLVGVAGGAIYLYGGIRCPVCYNRVGNVINMYRGGFLRLSKNIGFCPFCGIDMDSEIDQADEGQQ